MTDLQMSLIAAGGVFLVAVLSYNKWQEYKTKKSVQRAFTSEHDDVLMQAPMARQEPSLQAQPVEPVIAQAESAKPAQEPMAGANDTAALPVDPLIDCVIQLALEKPVAGAKVLPLAQTLRHAGKMPVHFIGHSVSRQEWQPLHHQQDYGALRLGVQLANRAGALNEVEYSELVARLRQIADDLGAEPDLPDMVEVMERARSLHQFAAEHDAQLGINIQSNGAPWAMSTLLVALEKYGFDMRSDGRFVMMDGEGGYLFSLATNASPAAETTQRLTLLLDVPCVAPARNAFGMMVSCAKSLATRLGGVIVDDGNAQLADQALEQIAAQVNAFYDEMQASKIPAGSVRALRLFT